MTAPPAGANRPEIQHGTLPAVDPGNQFISVAPVNLTCSVQDTPVGQRLFATIRSVNATLTATLAPDEVDSWIEVLRREKAKMTGLILPSG